MEKTVKCLEFSLVTIFVLWFTFGWGCGWERLLGPVSPACRMFFSIFSK